VTPRALPCGGVIVDGAFILICELVILDLLDEADDLRAVFSHACEFIRITDIEILHVLEKALLVFFGEFGEDGMVVALNGRGVERVDIWEK
jgi:hypothetical protein